MKSHWESRNGVRYLYCDFSGFRRDLEALTREVDEADAVILAQPEDSVLLLVDLRNTVTTSAVVNLFKRSSAKTKGRVSRQAVVGVSGIQRVLAQAVALFSHETFVLFDDTDTAAEWLASERAAPGTVISGGK